MRSLRRRCDDAARCQHHRDFTKATQPDAAMAFNHLHVTFANLASNDKVTALIT